MNHLTILIIKFITCLIAFGLGLDLFFDATFVDIVSFSLFVTVASYVLGDRIILPQLGRRAAAVADFLLTYLSVWIFGSILLDNYVQIGWGSIISATIITVAEVFVHLFLQDRIRTTVQNDEKVGTEKKRTGFNPKLAFSTEFASDDDIKEMIKAAKKTTEKE
ncbi:YndM family protein [Metabacillus niabensis]|uniref:Membrane protein YdbS with pleckstrin-like domain n=1 Tax=Metabacillus niabensis TaxID=324854 RepID=A0ABT9YUX6_9BACI|nr:YndM family protein [Metabacillus niabensis]MDQ0223801.1 membrane protein YdbS with pleckstrin-like domain [Metabacillus niabensis]